MSLMFVTAVIVAVLGVVTLAYGLAGTSGSLKQSHDSSIGHNCFESSFREGFLCPQSRSSDFPLFSFHQLYHNANIPLAPVMLITLYYENNVSLLNGWSTFVMVKAMPFSQGLDLLPCPLEP